MARAVRMDVLVPDPVPRPEAPGFAAPDDVAALLKKVQQNDVRAFDRLFFAYYARLCNFAVEHGVDHDTACDIVQDVMVSFWQRRGEWSLATGVALSGYLFQAVRNLVARTHRDRTAHVRAAERRVAEGRVPGHGEVPLAPDVRAMLGSLESDLDATIDAMPADRRVAVSLRLHDGLSYDEIAEIMGVSAVAIRMHLSRARVTLAETLRKHRE
jgi:RNA polymerase sigma-70 factor (ECF subfamily)